MYVITIIMKVPGKMAVFTKKFDRCALALTSCRSLNAFFPYVHVKRCYTTERNYHPFVVMRCFVKVDAKTASERDNSRDIDAERIRF